MILSMALSAMALTGLADCVPVRWPSGETASVALLESSPFNCVVLERAKWSAEFQKAAESKGIRVVGLLREEPDFVAAAESGLTAFAAEGEFREELLKPLRARFEVVEIGTRKALLAGADAKVAGTNEALWPGIRIEDESGKAHSAPSGAPWIDTNGGFIRFARAMTGASLWMAQRPAPGRVYTVEQYVASAADAYVSGARWLVALDPEFEKRLMAGEKRALADWSTLGAAVRFLETKREWLQYPPSGQLAIVQDVESGAAYSAGLMDMIGVRHTPTRIIPTRKLNAESLRGVALAINIQPSSLPDAGKEVLRGFTRGGGRLFNSPPDWHFPQTEGYVLVLEKIGKDELAHFDLIWKQITSQTWNRNLGAKLYNVASMLSNLVASPNGTRSYLMLVNYSGYESENVTVHVPGKFVKATLHQPGAAPRSLEVYGIEEGVGVDIEKFGVVGIVELAAR